MTDGERAIIETKSQAARESAEAAMLADMDDKPTLDELPGLLAVELATVGRALSSVSRNIICGILDDAVGRAKAAEDERDALRAELEAQQAAQQWRPVTESEPYDDDVEIIVVASRSGVDGVWYYADETEDGINLWQEPRLWRPLPTPPATAEATE